LGLALSPSGRTVSDFIKDADVMAAAQIDGLGQDTAAVKNAEGAPKGFKYTLPDGEVDVVVRTWVGVDAQGRFDWRTLEYVEPTPASRYGQPYVHTRVVTWSMDRARGKASVEHAENAYVALDGTKTFQKDHSKEVGAVFEKLTLKDLEVGREFDQSKGLASPDREALGGASVSNVSTLHPEGLLTGVLAWGLKKLVGVGDQCNTVGNLINAGGGFLFGGIINALDPITGAIAEVAVNSVSCAAGAIIDPPQSVMGGDLGAP
jgi:hypothetical protein